MNVSYSRRAEIVAVYLAGLVQGICFVTFPAASSIFRSPEAHGLTSSEYGTLFLPMIVFAIIASSLGGVLVGRWGAKQVFLLGLAFNLASMILLALSQALTGVNGAAFGVLLFAMGALGLGFGGTLTTINAYAAHFFPEKSATALTVLHAVLGTGTALAPVLLNGFMRTVGWWGQPLALAGTLVIVIFWSWSLSLNTGSKSKTVERGNPLTEFWKLPAHFWSFGGIAVFYGICETIFGNWATIFLHEEKQLNQEMATFALSMFWASVTAGRILVAICSIWFPSQWFYRGLPFLVVARLLAIPSVQGSSHLLIGFIVAGLGCSALLPLTIDSAEQNSRGMAELASGVIMSTYMIGYGLGAYSIGPIRDLMGVSLSGIYAGSSIFAMGIIMLEFFMTRKDSLSNKSQAN